MSRIAYFDCFSGISGDMTLGSLVDAGLDAGLLQNELAKLKLEGYKIRFSKIAKGGIYGTKAQVDLIKHDHDESRYLNDILQLIDHSDLSKSVKKKAELIFERLAVAEAKVHNTTKDKVHFHEVGAIDSIVDIVGSVIGIELLGIEEIYASPLPLGSGFVKCAHGLMPIPAPGTLELVKGVPVLQSQIKFELVTPTGAAIITSLARDFGPMPEMIVDKIGYGAGQKELEAQPNLLRICIGEKKKRVESQDKIAVIETNIDDMSPQLYDFLMDKLFDDGALDVFLTQILMKKNRPAVKLSVLAESHLINEITSRIFSETTTIGVRIYEVYRQKLPRDIISVETPYGKVRLKLTKIDDLQKAMPEYEDCKKIAEEKDVPIRLIYESAMKAYNSLY